MSDSHDDGGRRARPPRILVAEDDFLIAQWMQIQLEQAGYHPLGPVRSCRDGLSLCERQSPDAAILDVKLTDGLSAPIAEWLHQRRKPLLVVTAMERTAREEPAYRGATRLSKPIHSDLLLRAVDQMLKFEDE